MEFSVTTVMGEDYCPGCKKLLGQATGPRTPMPNDITVCIGCGSCLRFADDMHLELLTEAEFKQLDPSTQVQLQRIQWAIQEGKKSGL